MDASTTDAPEAPFKVVLVFHLVDGTADEELRRSLEPGSFPNRLARQPGFVDMQLVKVGEAQTLSVQTWQRAGDWWAALEAVKHEGASASGRDDRPAILVSRDFHAGPVVRELRSPSPAAQ